ncbi:MAG: hypothetical protein WC616_02410 [Candidatus Omnitrophota bacterium]
MPSIQQIVDFVDRKYPNSETDANKVSDLNDIHKRVYVKMSRLKNETEKYEITSIASQLTYNLPADGKIDDVALVLVPQSITITASTEWEECEFAGIKDDTTTGYYYGDGGNGLISFLYDDLPIATAGLSIRLFYWKRPNALSSADMSATPELDEDYHDVLKFQLVSELASQGHNPDTEIADFWQRKADEFLRDIETNLSERYNKTPTQSCQAEEWF